MTAEAALALPALLLVLAVAVLALAAVTAQVRCGDAARAAVRLAARGEPPARVEQAALLVAPAGARVRVTGSADLVRVEVSAHLRPPGPLLGRLPAVRVSSSSTARREDALGTARSAAGGESS